MKRTLWICLSLFCLTSIALSQQFPQAATLTKSTTGTLSTSISSSSLAQNTLDQRLADLSEQIAENLTENQKRTIAVVEFSDLVKTLKINARLINTETRDEPGHRFSFLSH
jgi:LPS O-antigen subunit length determinant protein (WzzB/FepE family)